MNWKWISAIFVAAFSGLLYAETRIVAPMITVFEEDGVPKARVNTISVSNNTLTIIGTTAAITTGGGSGGGGGGSLKFYIPNNQFINTPSSVNVDSNFLQYTGASDTGTLRIPVTSSGSLGFVSSIGGFTTGTGTVKTFYLYGSSGSFIGTITSTSGFVGRGDDLSFTGKKHQWLSAASLNIPLVVFGLVSGSNDLRIGEGPAGVAWDMAGYSIDKTSSIHIGRSSADNSFGRENVINGPYFLAGSTEPANQWSLIQVSTSNGFSGSLISGTTGSAKLFEITGSSAAFGIPIFIAPKSAAALGTDANGQIIPVAAGSGSENGFILFYPTANIILRDYYDVFKTTASNRLDIIQSELVFSTDIVNNGIGGLDYGPAGVVSTHTNFSQGTLTIGSATFVGSVISTSHANFNLFGAQQGAFGNITVGSATIIEPLTVVGSVNVGSITSRGTVTSTTGFVGPGNLLVGVSSITGGSYYWNLINGTPAGFADGVDNEGAGGAESDPAFDAFKSTGQGRLNDYLVFKATAYAYIEMAGAVSEVRSSTAFGPYSTSPVQAPFGRVLFEQPLSTKSQEYVSIFSLPDSLDTSFDPEIVFAETYSTGTDRNPIEFIIAFSSGHSGPTGMDYQNWSSSYVVSCSTLGGNYSDSKKMQTRTALPSGVKTVFGSGARTIYCKFTNVAGSSTIQRFIESCMIAIRRRT